MTRFCDKTVLITGATSGIGLAGARRIADEGGRLILTGRSPASIQRTRQSLPATATVLANEAADPDAVSALVAAARQQQGLDGLWLNAGMAEIGPLEQIDAATFDRLMAVNVRAPALQLAALAPWLKPGASVVITASSSAYETAPLASLYAGGKAALIAMARCWATELAARRIRVNVLVPGPINTHLRRDLDTDSRQAFEQAVIAQVPLGRWGSPAEAAAVALFLLSDEAAWVTGSQYAVDGGLIMR